MKLKKGKRNTEEWEQMLVDSNNDVCVGLHFFDGMLKLKEKQIIAKNLTIAAEEIKHVRSCK